MWCLIHWNLLTHMNLNTGTLLVSHTAGWGMPIYINRILFLVMSLLWFCSTTKPTVSPPANNSNEIATHTRFADRIVEFGEWNLIYFSLKIPSSIHHWIAFFFFFSLHIIACSRYINDTLHDKIAGNSTAAYEGEFPHMAALFDTNRGSTQFACGASIISRNFVLTAAHCVKNPAFVRVGQVSCDIAF